MLQSLLSIVSVVIIFVILFQIAFRRIIIMEYERGLRYRKGRFKKVVGAGQYWIFRLTDVIHKVDTRPRFVSVTGQEVLSADGVTLKVSLAANYEIADPAVAINRVQNFQEALYLQMQIGLREIIGSTDIDAVLQNRADMSARLMDMTAEKAKELGLNLISVNVKDILFPGKLKETFAQVVSARKEGLATLERARGETAALRNLTNAAKLVESNPNLLQLRLIQALGQPAGNTLVLGMPSGPVFVPIKGKEANKGNGLQEAGKEPPQMDPDQGQ